MVAVAFSERWCDACVDPAVVAAIDTVKQDIGTGTGRFGIGAGTNDRCRSASLVSEGLLAMPSSDCMVALPLSCRCLRRD